MRLDARKLMRDDTKVCLTVPQMKAPHPVKDGAAVRSRSEWLEGADPRPVRQKPACVRVAGHVDLAEYNTHRNNQP